MRRRRYTHSGGSSNSSEETSAHVFSTAPTSPGEQGVSFLTVVGGSEPSTGTSTWNGEGARGQLVFKGESDTPLATAQGHWTAVARKPKAASSTPESERFNPTHLLEVGSAQHFANGLHKRISNDDSEIGSGVALRLAGEQAVLGLSESAGGGADVELEHAFPCVGLGERNIDALLESVKARREMEGGGQRSALSGGRGEAREVELTGA
jgi:hypothetical protein